MKKLTYNKSYLTSLEHIQLLKNKHLTFQNEDKSCKILEQISYSRMKQYLESIESEDNTYENVSFEDAFALYRFDKKLRILLLDAVETIEISWRTNIKNYLGSIDLFPFENNAIFNENSEHFENFSKARKKNWNRSKEKFKKDFENKYSTPPVWIEMETWSMGCLRDCILSLHSHHIEDSLCMEYIKRHCIFTNWLKSLTSLRNKCAHHSCVWNAPKNNLGIPSNTGLIKTFNTVNEKEIPFKKQSTYTYCLVIWYILKNTHTDSQWNKRLYKLINEFPDIYNVSIKNMGFPDNWDKEDFWGLND